MPFTHTCRDHPNWSASAVDGVILHVAAEHPGMSAAAALNGGPVSVAFTSQLAARGHHHPTRIFGCPHCGIRVETTDPVLTTCGACA